MWHGSLSITRHVARLGGERKYGRVEPTDEWEQLRLLPADLDRTSFAEHFMRVLDPSGYAVWNR